MSNYYDDSFVYAIDRNNQKHLIAQCSSASLGCGYRDEVFIKDKAYTVFFGVDDDDMSTEVSGSFLPYLHLIDCCSLFSEQPTILMQQAIKEADIGKANIEKLVWLHFESNPWHITSSEGYVITADNKYCIASSMFENAISQNTDIELIADDIISQVSKGACDND